MLNLHIYHDRQRPTRMYFWGLAYMVAHQWAARLIRRNPESGACLLGAASDTQGKLPSGMMKLSKLEESW
jgi:hypothetical protein